MKSIFIIKHEKSEGPGTLENYLISARIPYTIIELAEGQKLPSSDKCAAIISLGGSMNVYEEEKFTFLLAEDAFLRKAIELQIPTLGICLGAQLLAKCMGARVEKAAKSEIGWYTVDLSKSALTDPLFCGLPRTLETFQWHGDTFDMPDKGIHLASSGICENQAMRIGRCAWGLQFHPEMTVQMIEEWSKASTIKVDAKGFIDRHKEIEKTYVEHATLLYNNFMKVVNSSSLSA